MSLRVAVVGASGYVGAELVRILLDHRHVALCGVYGLAKVGAELAGIFPQFYGRTNLRIEAWNPTLAQGLDAVFLALPHGAAAEIALPLLQQNIVVFDLSADFRLEDAEDYQNWYGKPHPNPSWLEQSTYGLPEIYREKIKTAQLVACPGCYPTSALLATYPLLAANVADPEVFIVDAKSGVSGAGRSPTGRTHFCEVSEGIRAYGVGGTHRHTPEIEQTFGRVLKNAGTAMKRSPRVLFTPHLVAMNRGILSCVYVRPRGEVTQEQLTALYTEQYRDETFVQVLPPGVVPETQSIRGTNAAHVNVFYDPRSEMILAMSVLDNLVKGAAGQAVQCFNIRFSLGEDTALSKVAVFP